jgi:hypothetical protein
MRVLHQNREAADLMGVWQLQGYVNWVLNVFPKLRLALCATYAKTAGKTKPHAPVRINTGIAREMEWLIQMLKV